MLLCFCGVPIFDEICYKDNLSCSSLDLFFAVENNYIFTNFSALFHPGCHLECEGSGFCCWILNLRDNMKKSKYIRWYFEEGVNWPRGWNRFFPSTHPRVLQWVRSKLCWYWSQQKLTRILSLGRKKKKPEVTEKVWIEKERRDFLLWIVINIECSATALALGKWHFVFFQSKPRSKT